MSDSISNRLSLTDIDESLIRNFETDWMKGNAAQLDRYLPEKSDARYLATLEELIHIELEFRWKSSQGRTEKAKHSPAAIESYLQKFSILDHPKIIERLAYQEFLVRHRFGDKPGIEEYCRRFPGVVSPNSDWETPTVQHEEPTTETPAQGDLMDRYELVVEEGRGGFGAVWRAHDPKLNREIAIKKLNDRLVKDERFRQRFENEARITARLEHPGIVPIYDIGKLDGASPFYTMKLVQGETLDDAILKYHQEFKSGDRQSVEQLRLLNVFLSVTRAMEYAHSCGVIHRDLKPQNIILGKYGETIILDWGLAKILDDDSEDQEVSQTTEESENPYFTQPGTVQGTPAYMSPEQASGLTDEVDQFSDIYMLGIVLYNILTGRVPFPADSSAECLELVKQGNFSKPHCIEENVSPALEAICVKAMQTRKEDRYGSVTALRKDVERFLADDPLEAWQEPLIYRLGRWTRRHRTMFVASMVGLIVIGMSSVAGWIQYERHHQNEMQQMLEQSELENRQLAELRTAAEASKQTAIDEIYNGRYRAALKFLERGEEVIAKEQKLSNLRNEIARNRLKTQKLISFQQHAEKAEQFAYLEMDREAVEECLIALNELNVFENLEWWNRLPKEDLSPETLDRLREDVYHQLVLLTAIRMKLSVSNIQHAWQLLFPPKLEQMEDFRLILNSAKMVRRFRPADSVRIMEEFCMNRLGLRKKLPDVSQLDPQNASDSYVMGVVLFFIGAFADDPMTKLFLQGVIQVEDPLTKSREMLANASRLNPQHFQTHFFLGWCEEYAGRMSDAEKAYGHCIALRPRKIMPYINRARIYMRQAIPLFTSNKKRSSDLLRLCLRDLEQAAELDPYNSDLHFSRGQILAMLEFSRTDDSDPKIEERNRPYNELALDSFFRALDFQRPLDTIGSDRLKYLANDQISSVYQFLNQLQRNRSIQKHRLNLLLVELDLTLNRRSDAQTIFDTKIEGRSSDLKETYLRGLLNYQQKKFEKAMIEFDAVLAVQADHFNALLNKGHSLEAMEKFDSAIETFRKAEEHSLTSWRKAEALLGEARCFLKKSRLEEAVNAIRSALIQDPKLHLRRLKSVFEEYGRNEEFRELVDANTKIAPIKQTQNPSQNIIRPALLSGGFELGLSRHWGLGQFQQGKPIWWNSNGCRSTATVVSTEAHSGKKSLLIENFTKASPRVYGTTQQAIPITAKARYRVSLWAKTRNLEKLGFRVVVNDAWDVIPINLPAGSYEWTKFEGEFSIPTDIAQVRLVSLGVGQVWIDDITIEMIDPPERIPKKK